MPSIRQGCLFGNGDFGEHLYHTFEHAYVYGEDVWPVVCRYCDSTEDQSGYITESEKLKAARDLVQLQRELKNG